MSKFKQATLDLDEEVKLLRSFVIGLSGKDEEGDYRPEFIERTLNALKEKTTNRFIDSRDFLKRLKTNE